MSSRSLINSPAHHGPAVYLTVTLASLLWIAPVFGSDEATVVEDFLAIHCVACHDSGTAAGDREFESFALPLADHSALITADEIIDQVTLGEMPPPDEVDVDELPTDDERLAVLAALRGSIDAARDRLDGGAGQSSWRRLSHREYENTLADLFQTPVETLGLTKDFPAAETEHHLDNVAAAMVTSGFLLDQYFAAADRLVTSRLERPAIEPQAWRFDSNFVQYEELRNSHKQAFNNEYLCLYEQPNSDTRQGGYGHIEDFLDGVPVSGVYDITVHAKAMHRDTHYDPNIFRIDFAEPFQLAVVPGDASKGHIHYPQPVEPELGRHIVPDDHFGVLTYRVFLEAGQTPRFTFPNGPYESRASVIKINQRYNDEFPRKTAGDTSRTRILRFGRLPHIRISEVTVRGPIADRDIDDSETAVFGPGGFDPTRAVEQLTDFTRRAFRRPLTLTDRVRVDDTYAASLDAGASPRRAALDVITMTLCSPSFLHLGEPTGERSDRLPPHDLAARLSYALWAGPPDEALETSLAADPSRVRRPVERLLDDPRSRRFVAGFTDAWLGLSTIGDAPPPREIFPDYYGRALPRSMRGEAQAFFDRLLRCDGPIDDLLDSDYVVVDKTLAEAYGLPDAKAMTLSDDFRKIDLRGNRRRGGVLGMAGVLTASANGVETSPVTRGVWVSENLLGVIPPPPPDEVPAIDPDVSGATTIRDRLEAHRADAACNVCHRKIDPLGFALENYDPIGKWRGRYWQTPGKNKPPVDPSGVFPSGETYDSVAAYKTILNQTRRDRFRRHLTSKLIAYATGRRPRPTDRYAIDDILTRTDAAGGGLRTLVIETLASPGVTRP